MKISEIDKNLKVESSIQKDDIVWLSPKDSPFVIYNASETERDMGYHRMPDAIAKKVNSGVAALNFHSAGIRVRFKTNSPYIAIKSRQYAMQTMPHIAKTGQSGFDLYDEQGFVAAFVPPYGVSEGYESLKDTHGGEHTYTINFPLYDIVEELYIGLSKDAILLPPDDYKHPKPVLFYGSSITQGGCASRPGNCYQSLISRSLDTDYINLGFSGSAKAEEIMAQYLATLNVSVFVYDYDWNAESLEELKEHHYPFYKKYRELRPTTPIVFVTRPDFSIYDESSARRDLIKQNYEKAKSEGDNNVYFIDGETLFAGEHRDSCTVDGCHPNDLGFFRMSQVIGAVLKDILK